MAKRNHYYAVVSSKFIGVVNTWDECKPLSIGVKDAKFKRFNTRTGAEYFVKTKGEKPPDVVLQENMITDYFKIENDSDDIKDGVVDVDVMKESLGEKLN